MGPAPEHTKTFWTNVVRIGALIMCLTLAGTSAAQKANEFDYLIRFGSPLSTVQEKYVHEVLQAHEAGLGIWVDAPNAQVKVRTHLPLDRDALQTQWAEQGTVIIELVRLNSAAPFERIVQEAPAGQPQFIATGDPAADNAAYEAAKAAWIASQSKTDEAPGTIAQPK